MEKDQLKTILEAVLMAASSPLTEDALFNMFEESQRPERDEFTAALEELISDCDARSYELKKISSGYRFQVKKDYADYVSRLWDEKPARYSRALLETMALIAYRQPITRGEIEAVRGVSVSSTIIKTLDERNWIKVVGHRDVPGKPALYATTKEFLDYFNIESLDDLPSLQEIRDIDAINAELDLRMPGDAAANSDQADAENASNEEVPADDNAAEAVINLEMAEADETDAATGEEPSADDSETASSPEMAAADDVDNATAEESPVADNAAPTSLDASEESDQHRDDVTSSTDINVDDEVNPHLNAAPASAEH